MLSNQDLLAVLDVDAFLGGLADGTATEIVPAFGAVVIGCVDATDAGGVIGVGTNAEKNEKKQKITYKKGCQ